jgi:hypothetical protein
VFGQLHVEPDTSNDMLAAASDAEVEDKLEGELLCLLHACATAGTAAGQDGSQPQGAAGA